MVPWRSKEDRDPDECGGFRLTHRIGSGGFGTVFLGFRSDVRSPAAVKIFTSPNVAAPAWRDRFRREIKLIKQMAGVHTAELLDSGGDDEPPWLATRYVHAPPLDRLVHQYGIFEELPGWWLAASLGEALAEIHAKGILHRDLKPQNVLVERTGIKIIDFGISRFSVGSDVTETTERFGTHPYCANEHLLDVRNATEKSDVFALGATLVWATTGHTPFEGMAPHARLAGMPPDLDRVPDALVDLVESCLALKPETRPTALQVFQEALIHLADHAVPLASGSGLPLPAEVRDFVDVWAATPIPMLELAVARPGSDASSGVTTTGTGSEDQPQADHARTADGRLARQDVFSTEWRGRWRRAAERRRDGFGK
ncbi:serine/threonine protein kinase [Micromonospora aurantiaca (nom. illeg.)]|uniref:serine/threonine protein kinase n=1 Tax=Micromonospora aurantiaca (nom. illeg.) TaxID=47850 RepID=UPI003668C7D9